MRQRVNPLEKGRFFCVFAISERHISKPSYRPFFEFSSWLSIMQDEEYYKKLPEPCDDELDMLDLAFDLKETWVSQTARSCRDSVQP